MTFKPFLYFFLFCHTLLAQEVLWAEKVLEVSSEHTDTQYSPINRADQVLGKPSIYPQLGKSASAWQPNGSDFGEDYIKVRFNKAIEVKQVLIIENINPGSIVRIFGYDITGKEYLLYQNTDLSTKTNGRLWAVKVTPATEKIDAVKLLISHRVSKGIKQIDAIGITDSEQVPKIAINLAENIPENLQKENLGSVINSRFGELAPIITPDGKTLYFTRDDHPENIQKAKAKEIKIGQDIWVATLGKSNNWEIPTNIGTPINTELDNAAATVSAEGSLYILNVYNSNGTLGPGLSVTKSKNGDWNFPEKVVINNFQALEITGNDDVKKINTEFSISHDRRFLIMGLKRHQNFGNNDLYVSFLQPDNTYSVPLNMGKVLNTAESEGSPFLSADNKTLYFSSKGHPGYGDNDIFLTRRLDDTWMNWSEPQNLGPQINSPFWDGYFSIPASGEFAYLSSKDNSVGAEDIFRIRLFESIKPEPVALISGKITDAATQQTLLADLNITVINDTTGKVKINIEKDEEKNEFKIIVPVGFKYQFNVSLADYISQEEIVDLTREKSYRELHKNFELIPIKPGQKMVLNQLLFEQGKAEIELSSFDQLNQIIALMKKYPGMQILLEGYTDNQGDFSLNVKLSESRVTSVRDYLMKKGPINKNRIEIKAWGPLKPVSSNSTEDSRKKNRRVEFTILKM